MSGVRLRVDSAPRAAGIALSTPSRDFEVEFANPSIAGLLEIDPAGRCTVQGKTVVLTGATSGIGEVAACALAQQGARIVLIARDRGRGEHTLGRLEAVAPGRNHVAHYANLSRLTETKRVAEIIAGSEPRI